MAHFAKLDENNIVTNVFVIGNGVHTSNGPLGENDMHPDGETYCRMILGPGNYKQTSYNNNFRGKYAGIGYSYDPVKDRFTEPQPYASWTKDEVNNTWVPPIDYPTTRLYIDSLGNEDYYQAPSWDEENQQWVSFDHEENKVVWNSSTSTWNSV